jgi:hypothetical protein
MGPLGFKRLLYRKVCGNENESWRRGEEIIRIGKMLFSIVLNSI